MKSYNHTQSHFADTDLTLVKTLNFRVQSSQEKCLRFSLLKAYFPSHAGRSIQTSVKASNGVDI